MSYISETSHVCCTTGYNQIIGAIFFGTFCISYNREQFLQRCEISRAYLPPNSHGEKHPKFQNVAKIARKAVFLIGHWNSLHLKVSQGGARSVRLSKT